MKRLTVPLFLVALAVTLGGNNSARAAIQWGHDWTPSTPEAGIVKSDAVGTYITLTNQGPLDAFVSDAVPVTKIVATNMTLISNAPADNPDYFGSEVSPKTFNLTVKLSDGGKFGTNFKNFTFEGRVFGVGAIGASSVEIYFVGKTAYTNELIGNNLYDISVGPITVPAGPDTTGVNLASAINFLVSARPKPNGGDPNETPEPSSMALAGLGLALSSFAAWRKRRSRASQLAVA